MNIDRRALFGTVFAAALAAQVPALAPALDPVRLLPITDSAIMGIWTRERLEQMRALCAQGCTASEIARELPGVTRNMIIGKVHRLRWMPAWQVFRNLRGRI